MSLLMDALKKAEKKPTSSDIPKEQKELPPPPSIEISNEEFSDFHIDPLTTTNSPAFDETEQLSLVLEEGETESLSKEEPVLTDVAAQRMLDATKKRHNRSLKLKWLLITLFIAILLITGSYYYYNDFIEPSTLSQVYPRRKPLLSTTHSSPIEPDTTPVVVPSLPSQSPLASSTENKIITPLISVVEETAKNINANVAASLSSINELPTTNLTEADTNNITEENTAIIQTNGIKITRHTQTHSTQQVNRAYKAFQSGKLKQAETLYKRVLQSDQTSRDALLGLAAIAMHKGKLKLARQYYEKILKNYPRDTLAQTGVIATLTHTNMSKLEGQLKLLASRSKKADYIYFNLGNLYARQQRWVLAQDAYYQAYSYNHQQPTYLYNLAISLDKLGKTVPALQFYKQALKYATQQPIRFNKAMVKQRIAELNATTSPSALSRLNATP